MKLLTWLLEEERRAARVTGRVIVKVWEDGFIHAGNLAYLSMLALFPFFIIVGTIAGMVGRSADGMLAVEGFLQTVPPSVRDLLAAPIAAAITESSTGIVTLSIVVGLWTAASFVETIRDILARAYEARSTSPIWQRRLGSFAIIIGSVFVMLTAFAAQVLIVGAEQFVARVLPWVERAGEAIFLGRIGPMLALFVALYILFFSLTPQRYRRNCPKWPGAVATTIVWIGATLLLPVALDLFGSYDRFYGPLAGVMVTLIFFYIVGMGIVIGAELNAALAQTPKSGQKDAETAQEPEG